MKKEKGNLLSDFLVWRLKHVSQNNFVLILSIVIGIAAGLAAVILKLSVLYIHRFLLQTSGIQYHNYLFIAFPLAGILLTITFVRYFNKNKLGHGLTNVIYSINKKAGRIETDKMYSHMLTGAMTVGFGGSVGLEAPIVTTGSAIGSNLSRIFHLGYKKRTLLIGCGAAGAISAIFSAPITGVVFALEILLIELTVPSFIPILLASVTGTLIADLFLGDASMFSISLNETPELIHIPFYVALGTLAGLISVYYSRITYRIEELFLKIKGRYKKGIIGGVILGILIFLFPPLYGEGYVIIKSLLSENPAELFYNSLFYDWIGQEWSVLAFLAIVMLMKAFAATITFSSGGNGGIFAPSLFTGALTGFFFARLVNFSNMGILLPEKAFTLVGMAGVMSGVLHAPLTGIFLIAEITSGYMLILPLMIVSAIAYVTIIYYEPNSVYTKQLARKGELFAYSKDREVISLMDLKRVTEKGLQTVNVDGKLQDLVKVVAHSKRNIFPVTDDENKLYGIILLDDIRNIMFDPSKYENVTVKELMHEPPGYINEGDNMDDVMQKFENTGAWNLPVISKNGKYIGIVSKSKLFSIYRRLLVQQSAV